MDGMQWMASAMQAARAQLETATHNLANVSSDGFRRVAADVRLGERGITVRERVTSGQGALRHTGRAFDLALVGPGAFRVGTGHTRSGAFIADRMGRLTDDRGRLLLGERGPVRIGDATRIGTDGSVREGDRVVNRIPLPAGTTVASGSLETSTVDAIGETLAILTAQRAFETAEKTFAAIDGVREKAASDVARLK